MIRQVYVAGKYTAETRTQEVQNISRALAAGCSLAAAGWHPIVPHVSGSHRVDWETAMSRYFLTIRGMDPKQDALVLLPGWEDSRGARAEVALAEELGLPVLTVAKALEARP